MQYQRLFEHAPVAIFLINTSRKIVRCNWGGGQIIGDCCDQVVDEIFDDQFADVIGDVIFNGRWGDPLKSCFASIRSSNGDWIRVHGCVDLVSGPGLERMVRATMLIDPDGQRRIDKLFYDQRLLKGMADTATEAMWCIEFHEPVELFQSRDDIVRQIFENDRRWVNCNDAMAALYRIPDGLDFNSLPVEAIFRRSAENEAFVKQIIDSEYFVDNALSIDFRHDGTPVYVENTVRADIENGHLLRLWGTVRDVTSFREAQNRLQQQIWETSSILAAIPGGILVIDRQRKLLALNPAVERLLGWKTEDLLGGDVQKIMDLERPLPGGRRWYGCDRQRWSIEVLTSSGGKLLCDAQLAPVGDDSPPEKFVITLRPALVEMAEKTQA